MLHALAGRKMLLAYRLTGIQATPNRHLTSCVCTRIGWPGASMLWLGETTTLFSNSWVNAGMCELV